MLSQTENLANAEEEIPVYVETKEKRGSQYPRRSRKLSPLSCGCIGFFILLTMACCAVPAAFATAAIAVGIIHDRNTVTERRSESLSVSNDGDVNLVVTNTVGETRIRGANVDEIQVEMDLKAHGFTRSEAEEAIANMVIDVRREGDDYVIEVKDQNNDSSFWSGGRSVDLRITVPKELNVTAQSDVGTLSVRDVEIIDQLDLRNDVGEIIFEGKLGPEGDHRITNNVGSITLQLDNDSRFHLQARTDVGGVDANIDLAQKNIRNDGPTEFLSGIYGDDEDPAATLTITSDVGSIDLRD